MLVLLKKQIGSKFICVKDKLIRQI